MIYREHPPAWRRVVALTLFPAYVLAALLIYLVAEHPGHDHEP